MKKLNVSFDGTADPTGYLFSLVKCLSAALRCGGYAEFADDIVAASGFSFRMWAAPDLCPSETSIWEFAAQKRWVENGGLTCGYAERLWGQDDIEAERRETAIKLIRDSTDNGTAAVAWDISGCEWGLVTGYDDDTETFATLRINGQEDTVRYEKLGRLELPILSVLTVTGKAPKVPEQLVADTKALAKDHLLGNEWCDNAKGLTAYDTIMSYTGGADAEAWKLMYTLGTYAALKSYAVRFFRKYNEDRLAERYETIYGCWKDAFDAVKATSSVSETTRRLVISDLGKAKSEETVAVDEM